ncbi:MAG: 2-amino-4-hydroxy-6-hydroxymethyldihydropteridine diphosphokinase [Clostridiales bacterium]|jgi:dihydroneopterin aldolase/2-amino-4-hydroxy-6-hydroxymethyldihydropteridine diphosphokinase|nr:2-amino-4-hydroxy-6-hydroxymethyldihydropteridine diphosphokinase [Clostridiales bacterium]
MDEIEIKQLEVYCNHGVFPEEIKLGQKFLVSARLSFDPIGTADDIKRAIDYGKVSHDIFEFMKNSSFKLIETLAQHLADRLLIKYKQIKRLELEIAKPWAPIGLSLKGVSVRIARGRHTAYLSAGANLGKREAAIRAALDALDKREDCTVRAVSPFIATKPYGKTDQPDFINCCAELETVLSPMDLLAVLQALEGAAGRERGERWAARTLDLDLLLYDREMIKTETLTLPHADMHNRAFVLEPLCEIAPGAFHPVLNKTACQLLAELRGK